MFIIGIDPGLTGAIGVMEVSDTFRMLGASVHDIPHINYGRQKIVNSRAMIQRASAWTDVAPSIVIERPQIRSGLAAGAMALTWYNYGRLTAAFELWEEVEARVWKKALGLSSNKDESLEMAQERFPWLQKALSRKRDHGRAEALLIAFWYHTHILRFPTPDYPETP